MKKFFKQSMALFLVLALVFGTLAPVVAWAESETPEVKTPMTEENAPEKTPPAEETQEAAPQNAEAEENAAPVQENETEANADELEISPEEEQNPVGEGETFEIGSFEDLQKYLEVKAIRKHPNDPPVQRFVLKKGKYRVTQDFDIDLNDAYFTDNEEIIKYGMISATDEMMFDGENHTITVRPISGEPSVALFGVVNATSFSIENLKVNYPGDISGFAFAQRLVAKDTDEELATAKGLLKNISVTVGGSVLPLATTGSDGHSNLFAHNFDGDISAGFSWHIENTNLETVNINIAKDIGIETRPAQETDMVAAYGLTQHYSNLPITQSYNAQSWEKIHNDNQPEVLKSAGHIIDLTIHVGGNIQAYGYNAGYAAGIGHNMSEAWMEKIKVTVDGDIVTNLDGKNTGRYSFHAPYAHGFSDELMNLTDSSLAVQNIKFFGKNLNELDAKGPYLLTATASTNRAGTYINLKNNNVTVNGTLQGECNQPLMCTIGFGNTWIRSNGTNWVHESANNTHTIGSIDLKGDKSVSFYALGRRWRTGQNPSGSYKLPEASLKKNTVTVGDVKIQSEGLAEIALLMFNFSNAKENTLKYGDMDFKAKQVYFYGMGNLRNLEPEKNVYENIAEDNNLKMGNLTIAAEDAPYISLLAGLQEKEQAMKNCTAKVGKVDIALNSDNPGYVGGMASYSLDQINGCRVFADSVKVMNEGAGNLYFGLGAAYSSNATIKDSGVFVDGDIELASERLYGGGFVGYADAMTLQDNDFQIDGKHTIGLDKGTYGGFVGFLDHSTLERNSSLLLSDFMSFVGKADGGTIDHAAHYVNGGVQYFCGLLHSKYDKELPTITNSTLLVEKDYADTFLYRKSNASDQSGNNYTVVVDVDSDFNRTAYKAEEETVTTAGGNQIPYIKKTGEPIAKINIAKRSFQEKYWNENVAPYTIGDAEKTFEYMTAKEKTGEISVFGVDHKDIVKDGGAKGALYDYDHRHAGLRSASGIALDLLGIKGSGKGDEEEPGTPPASTSVIVIVDPNGGMFSDGTTDRKTYTVKIGDTFVLPAAPTREGYKFIAWKAKDGTLYQPGDEYTVKRNGEVFTAQWEEEKKVEPTPNPIPIPKPQVPPHIAIPVIPKAGVGK